MVASSARITHGYWPRLARRLLRRYSTHNTPYHAPYYTPYQPPSHLLTLSNSLSNTLTNTLQLTRYHPNIPDYATGSRLLRPHHPRISLLARALSQQTMEKSIGNTQPDLGRSFPTYPLSESARDSVYPISHAHALQVVRCLCACLLLHDDFLCFIHKSDALVYYCMMISCVY